MRPGQFSPHCGENWEALIKLTHIPQAGFGEPFTELVGKLAGKFLDKKCAIFRPHLAQLLFLNDHTPDIPVRFQHSEIDGMVRFGPGAAQQFHDRLVESPFFFTMGCQFFQYGSPLHALLFYKILPAFFRRSDLVVMMSVLVATSF